MKAAARPSRLPFLDGLRLGSTGLRTRPLRVVLAALGVAVGIAAMLAVVGVSSSSRAELDRQLDALGTNLLRVQPGMDVNQQVVPLPKEASAMIERIGPVTAVGATGEVPEAHIYRNDHISIGRTGSIEVLAAQPRLLHTVDAQV